jgi:hypothetical protein
MSGTSTTKMLAVYEQIKQPTMFFSGMFQSPAANFYNSEEVEIDIIRSEEDVAVVLHDITAGYRMNSTDIATNKGFKPPVFKEGIPFNSFDLLKREPGDSPFADAAFRGKLISRLMRGIPKPEMKIRRAMELQASQVLQTGKVTLQDSDSNTLYELDYKPKTAHFPTAGTTWGDTGATPLDDIQSLAEVIRTNGLCDANELVFGETAFMTFLQNDDVKDLYDKRRMDQGAIVRMQQRGNGGIYRGTIDIGNYAFELWTYNGRYKDPATGTSTPFMDKGKVIVRDSMGRMDATFGAVPNIGKLLGVQNQVSIPELGRMSSRAGGMDLYPNVWMSPDGESLFAGVASRPLMIPTAIDTFGCLDTGL